MARQRFRRDATFGELAHVTGDLWKRPLRLVVFGREWTLSLTVDIDPKDGVEENQRLAFGAFNEDTPAIAAAAEEAIFRHYQAVCAEYRSRYGARDPNDKRVPLVRSVQEVYRLVEPEGVTFPYARHRPTFGILCRCSWEEEHGLAVKFEGARVVEVGLQDIVL